MYLTCVSPPPRILQHREPRTLARPPKRQPEPPLDSSTAPNDPDDKSKWRAKADLVLAARTVSILRPGPDSRSYIPTNLFRVTRSPSQYQKGRQPTRSKAEIARARCRLTLDSAFESGKSSAATEQPVPISPNAMTMKPFPPCLPCRVTVGCSVRTKSKRTKDLKETHRGKGRQNAQE